MMGRGGAVVGVANSWGNIATKASWLLPLLYFTRSKGIATIEELIV
jgi:hypothetical protein